MPLSAETLVKAVMWWAWWSWLNRAGLNFI